jgi:putative transposase
MHLLISEPQIANPSTVMQAIKLGVARRSLTSVPRHFWTKRFYDFNLWSQQKESEKLHYMHQNPVERGLVVRPEDWRWSSFRFYACGEPGPVRINDWSWWEEKIKAKVS